MDSLRFKPPRRPLVFGNMTTNELVREARHLFQQPSPIIAAMLDRLEGVNNSASEGRLTGDPSQDYTGRCPCCGCSIQLDLDHP